jgi:glycosyltransferase involved in cell wall biosynthesis
MLRSAAADRKSLKKALYYSLVDRKIFEGCACILCFNETDAAESRRFVPASKPVLILPNGVNGVSDPPSAAAFRRLYPALQGKRILLFLGRLHWSKNLALQLEAFSRLALRFPDLVWVLIGPDAGEAATLRKDIDLRNLSARVLFTGSLDNAICQDALAAADVVLLTSHHEGHSMAMNETLAAGAPLVMTSTVGFDAAGAAGAALIVPPDAARLVRAVSSILDNPALSSQMARAAREFASRHLAWPQIAGRLRAILQRILDGRALSEFEGFNPFQSAISSQV